MAEPDGAVRNLVGLADVPQVIVEHRRESPAPRTTVELERNSKGYRWNVTVAAEDPDEALATVARLDAELTQRYGAASS